MSRENLKPGLLTPHEVANRHHDHTSCFEGCDMLTPETCICDHPHGECLTCGCRLLGAVTIAAKERE
jgi:hypothetical protein